MPDRVAFIVMPFNRKPTGRTEKGIPAEVDVDAVRGRFYKPVLEGARLQSGECRPRRRRDDHLPDAPAAGGRRPACRRITPANANVYSKVGVRQAAREKGCVLGHRGLGAPGVRPRADAAARGPLEAPLPHRRGRGRPARPPQRRDRRLPARDGRRAQRLLASDLLRLYHKRDDPGDDLRAAEAEVATAIACRAAIAKGTAGEWVRPALLGKALDCAVAEAVRSRAEVESEGPASGKLETTISDLAASVGGHEERKVKAGLHAVLKHLQALL